MGGEKPTEMSFLTELISIMSGPVMKISSVKWPNWVGVSPPIIWRRKKNQLPKRDFIFYPDGAQSPQDS
jgi:hypothetical protein